MQDQPTATIEEGDGPPLPVRNVRRIAGSKSPDEKKGSLGLSLSSLTDIKILTAKAYASGSSQWPDKPVSVYTRLAQQIRTCWFTPGAPKLENHGFHAEVGSAEANFAKIILFKKAKNGKRGLQAYTIEIKSHLSGSSVEARNRNVGKTLDQSFKADLARWSKGETNCKS